ncbi:unnamed protein product [Protopolystoma xenopodis]|uniref:Uncharacterized protein n=1 Tax=Protopolystoma xenopodis TaxID=117903 RepID=A0A3S5AGI1_9PLAT|nr:unnamed protein product [Protopolystoma xenopodis]
MSGIRGADELPSPHGEAWRMTEYEQTISVPSYLITIACGRLGSK